MRARRQLTKGTEIAALEAQRNELEVRAEGALLGERRAALGRLAMVLMFGLVSSLGNREGPAVAMYIGFGYTLYSLVLLWGLYRRAVARVSSARWVPIVSTTIDYAFVSVEALISTTHVGFHPGQHAISTTILLTFAIARLSVWHIAYALACALASWIGLTIYAGEATSFPTLFTECGLLVVGFLLVMTNRALGQMFQGLRQRDNLTRFLPRQVAERVLVAGPNALAPVQREVTVLFSDIRGFTGMSEGLEPREVLAMLDDYFGRMSQIVKGHDGVVGKFMGDGMLAFWGVPDRIEDHASRAVRAARDMRRAIVELNQHREQEGKPPIKIGIGIHTGTVAAGMLGGQLQSEYTVIGDAVNVASRIEGLTKDHQVDLLLSETTWAHLGEPSTGRRVGEGQIRGRKEPVLLYTIET